MSPDTDFAWRSTVKFARYVLLTLTFLACAFELESIRDVLVSGEKYHFGSEVAGFPYFSRTHYIGTSAVPLVLGAIAFGFAFREPRKWWPVALQLSVISFVFIRPFVWYK